MAFKISGTTNEPSIILIIDQENLSIDTVITDAENSFDSGPICNTLKTVIGLRQSDYKAISYGSIEPHYYEFFGDTGVFGTMGNNMYSQRDMDSISISTFGNSTHFGEFMLPSQSMSGVSNGIFSRAVFGGIDVPNSGSDTKLKTLVYLSINGFIGCSYFGDLTFGRTGIASASNGTNDRGVFGDGSFSMGDSGNVNVIDYITISNTSDAIDFGDLTVSRSSMAATSNGNNNRVVFGGGHNSGVNVMDYITLSSLMNATDFGDLSAGRYYLSALSNDINNRGVFAGGYSNEGTFFDTIEYINFYSLGDSTDFGNLTVGRYGSAGMSNGINERGIFTAGAEIGWSNTNIIDYITIDTTGDAQSFGETTVESSLICGVSNT